MTVPLPDAAAVRRALQRRFRTHPGVTIVPDSAADLAMAIVGPVLEDLLAEIERLRNLADGETTRTRKSSSGEGTEPVAFACGCRHEGWYDPKCACCNGRGAADVR